MPGRQTLPSTPLNGDRRGRRALRVRGVLWAAASLVFVAFALWHPITLDSWLFFPLGWPGWRYEEAEAISHVLAFGIAPAIAAGVGALAIARRHWWGLAGLSLLSLAWPTVQWVWKPLIARDRPWESELASFSYPSGHTTLAFALTGSILLLGASRGRLAIVALVGGLTAWYRVAGAVHWPSDVMGGAAFAGWVLLAVTRAPFMFPRPAGATDDDGSADRPPR